MRKVKYKLKLKFKIILIALIVLPFIFTPTTFSKYAETKTKHLTINAVQPTYTVVFHANGGSGSMDDQVFTYKTADYLRSNTFTNGTLVFDKWTTNSNGTGDEYTDHQRVNNLTKVNHGVIDLYAQWTSNIARIGTTYYTSLADAVAVANNSSTQTTIVLLQNTHEKIQINAGKDVILDLNGKTLSFGSGSGNDPNNWNVIRNYGTLYLKNGKITNQAATNGAVNNYSSGTITIDGVDIRVTSPGNRQAFYNEGGTATLTGGSYFYSESSGNDSRCAVTNKNNSGKMYVIDATIVSKSTCGLNNEGTLVIGTQGGTPSTTTPTIRGNTYGVTSDVAYSFYDGILQGKTSPVNDELMITNYESGYDFIKNDRTINNATYHVLYLGQKITITFDANQGTVSESSRDIEAGGAIGELPTPVRQDYLFDGWFSASSGGTQITDSTTFNSSTTIYAQWTLAPITYTLTFDTMGGNPIASLTNQVANTIVDLTQYTPTRSGYDFEGWYDDNIYSNKITSVTLTGDTTVYANWTLQLFDARIDSTNYTTLSDAWTAAMASNTTKTIVLLRDCSTTSAFSVSSSKSVIVDLNGHSINNSNGTIFEINNGGTFELTDTASGGIISGGTVNSANKQVPVIVNKTGGTTTISGGTVRSNKSQVIDNNGTMNITGGTVTFYASVNQGLINNNAGATLNISGGTINNPYAVVKGQAVYNLGALNISGDAVLISNSKERATVQNAATSATLNISGGAISSTYATCTKGAVENGAGNTSRITGGTITSVSTNANSGAVTNAGTLYIGTKDGSVNTTTPVLQGKKYGVNNSSVFNFYDGIIKGETNAINGTVSDVESGYQVANGTDGAYTTAYLELINNNNSINPNYSPLSINSPMGGLMITSEEVSSLLIDKPKEENTLNTSIEEITPSSESNSIVKSEVEEIKIEDISSPLEVENPQSTIEKEEEEITSPLLGEIIEEQTPLKVNEEESAIEEEKIEVEEGKKSVKVETEVDTNDKIEENPPTEELITNEGSTLIDVIENSLIENVNN